MSQRNFIGRRLWRGVASVLSWPGGSAEAVPPPFTPLRKTTLARLDGNVTRRCAACNDRTSLNAHAFAFDNNQKLLCHRCSVQRQGVYNAARERWSITPRYADLIFRERHPEAFNGGQ